ncbi:hypothetical protein [Nocardiopsis ganjiahuensis]|uniref:hypothetical protein n=1 Tax=Nocardiopsis ganjiahuensis TaxID=239984 RepID=UPI000345F23D|nr:hypothetical protein [Nocardiopsis ganjiahuensis]
MQVETIQVVGAVLVCPLLLLARVVVRAWVEERRLKHRLQITRSLTEGSTLSERLPDGTNVRITLGMSNRITAKTKSAR